MYLNQAIKCVSNLYRLQVETGERYSVEFVSGPGMGKSEAQYQIATAVKKSMGLKEFGINPFFLSTIEPPDVRGWPYRDGDVMKFTEAPWMPDDTSPKHGIVFLDEFRQAGHDTQKPAAELLLNGSVGRSKLPIEWMVIAASNREQDRSGVQRELAFVTNRRILIPIQPNLDSWVEWAEDSNLGNVHWVGIAFAKHQPGVVFADKVPDKPGPFCTPRSFVKVTRMIGEFSDSEFSELAAGTMGEGAAAQFISYMRVAQELPDFEDIKKSPSKCKLPDKDRPDAQHAVTQMIAHRVDASCAEAAFEYLKRMPREFQVSGIKAAMRKTGPSLLQSKTFAGWLRQNKDLLVAANLLDPNKGVK